MALNAIAIIGIGMPGSGKTHYLTQLAAETGADYCCAEDIRQQLNGDAADQANMTEVWRRMYRAISTALAAGRPVVIDATNYKPYDRQRLIRHCQSLADQIIGLWFVTPDAVCVERNANRDRTVQPHAMQRMRRYFNQQPPTMAEGFHQLLQLDTSQP